MNERFIVLKKRNKKSWIFDNLEGKIFLFNESGIEMLKLMYKNKNEKQVKKIFQEKFDVKNSQIFQNDFNRFKSIVKNKKLSEILDKKRFPLVLRNLQLCLTYRCNMSCRHCYQKNYRPFSYMPLGLVEKILSKVSVMHSIEKVDLTGGEPFLHRDIFTILKLSFPLLDQRKRVIVCTNGTILRQSEIKRIDNRIEFSVSLDGSTEKQNRIIRGSGKFQVTLKTIESLVDNGNLVTINFVVNRYTWRDMIGICNLGKKLGVSRINFLPLTFINESESSVRRLNIHWKERSMFLKEKKKIRQQFDRKFFSGKFLELNFLSTPSKGKFPIILPTCPAGIQKCYIEPNGDVIPCYYLKGRTGGNLNSYSVEQIWNFPSRQFERVRFPYVVDEKDMPGCIDCEYLSQCFNENFDNVLFSNLHGDLIKEIICYKL